jgi:NADH-quinone oxidoreductase subunit D
MHLQNATDLRTLTINMGPQHPSTHGVLRLVLELDGETVVRLTPHIGYLHSGIEKLLESKTYHQALVITDRMDYLAPMSNNLGYVLGVEKLLGIEAPERAQYARVILCELTRMNSHLVWLGTHSLDLGAMTAFFYTIREREDILNIFELVSGARMTSSYFRVGGLSYDLPEGFESHVKGFINIFPSKIDEYETLLTKNPIWLKRTKGVGVIAAKDAIDLGLSGPCARGSGVGWDVRKSNPYSGYERFDFEVPVGKNGDVYDRYLVRIEEMRQSVRIIRQVLKHLPGGPFKADAPKVVFPPKERVTADIETMIHHFKLVSEGFCPPKGEVYVSIESPKGELGYYIVSDGTNKPHRVRVRPPCFVNLQALSKMVEGGLLADVVATVGSIDIVLGEVDR